MDPQEKFLRKQNNIYRLHELVDDIVTGVSSGGPRFDFSEAMIKRLHGVAMTGLLAGAGEYRQAEVHIQNSPHKCPSWIGVPGLMTALCLYVNSNWETKDLIHLSAFVLWRLNWIHPFGNGNGRTARASAYLVLCAKNGNLFPPKNSLIEQIQRDKAPYYALLRQADGVFQRTQDITASIQPLEEYLSLLLTNQLQANF